MIGQPILWHTNTPPQDHYLLDGSLLAISASPLLYAEYGIKFGGDGRTTYQLPDLSNEAPSGFFWVVKYQ